MFRSIQIKFAHHALNTIRVFTQSVVQDDTFSQCQAEAKPKHLVLESDYGL